MLAAAPVPPAFLQVLQQEARAELTAELAAAEVQRLQRELDYAIRTARQAAADAATARQQRRRLERGSV
jgi:hypothetical protein